MLKRTGAALITALLVAACGSGSHSTSKPATPSSTAAGAPRQTTSATTTASSTGAVSSSSSASASSASTSTAASSSSSSSSAAAHHTHTQPPPSKPHFLVKLKIGAGGALTPPSIAIGGHTADDLSVSNSSGGSVKLEIAHGKQPVYTRTLPTGQTTAKLPSLKNATYTLLVDGRPHGTLIIGAKAGP